jgi:hypothetical protein
MRAVLACEVLTSSTVLLCAYRQVWSRLSALLVAVWASVTILAASVRPIVWHAHEATVKTLNNSTDLYARLCAEHTGQRSKKLSLKRRERAARATAHAEYDIARTTRRLRCLTLLLGFTEVISAASPIEVSALCCAPSKHDCVLSGASGGTGLRCHPPPPTSAQCEPTQPCP